MYNYDLDLERVCDPKLLLSQPVVPASTADTESITRISLETGTSGITVLPTGGLMNFTCNRQVCFPLYVSATVEIDTWCTGHWC